MRTGLLYSGNTVRTHPIVSAIVMGILGPSRQWSAYFFLPQIGSWWAGAKNFQAAVCPTLHLNQPATPFLNTAVAPQKNTAEPPL